MKKKHLLFGSLLVTFTGFGAYGIWHSNLQVQETSSSTGTVPLATESITVNQSPTPAMKTGEAVDEEVTPPMIQYVGPIKPDTSVYGETADIYRTYDIATLEELAASGDLMAIKVLAHSKLMLATEQELESLSKEEGHNLLLEKRRKKEQYLELAMIYGDTELASYASTLLHEDSWAPNHNTPAEIHNSLLKKLAFWEFIAMRGNQLQKFNEVPGVISVYSDFLGEPLILTTEDKTQIRDRAQAIYDNYEAKREELGLGPFEDIQEEIVSHYPGHNPTQEYIDEMGDNAF